MILSLNVTITFNLSNVHFIGNFRILEHQVLGASGGVTATQKPPAKFDIPKKTLDTSLQWPKSHICDALQHLVPFEQFKKCKQHPWRSVTFSKVAGFRLQLYLKKHSFMNVFHFFKIALKVPHHAKRLM